METEKKSFVKDVSNSVRSQMSVETWKKFKSSETSKKVILIVQNTNVLGEINTCVDEEIRKHNDLEKVLANGNSEDISYILDGWDFRKNKSKAILLKGAGNQAFGTGNNEKALDLYSNAIAFMDPTEKIDLSILYANRSASLFHLEEFKLAQADINSALELNYPLELQYKLFERSGRCFFQEGKNPEAARRFQQAIHSLSNPLVNLNEDKKNKVKGTLEKLLKGSTGSGFGFICNHSETKANSAQILPTVVGGRGKYLRNASPKVSLMRNDVEGRHVVANENIFPGEIIVVEKAYVSVLTPEAYHQQCFQCFSILRAPVPCSNCALVSFCSKKCRDLAWLTHHQYECELLGILRLAGVSITCLMALRTLTQDKFPEIRKWKALVSNEIEDVSPEKVKQGNWRDQQYQFRDEYRPDHISSLFKLVTNSRQRSDEDYFHRIIMALFLVLLLKRSTFLLRSSDLKYEDGKMKENFENKGSNLKQNVKFESMEPLGDDESIPDPAENGTGNPDDVTTTISLGIVFLRILETLQFNAHEIAGWDPDMTKSCFIGGGLFPTLAFFNHSCNPAIVRYFINDTVVVRTVRTIQRGEPITENYGPVFTELRKEERQLYLKSRYWFDCNCIACIDDWPLFKNLSSDNLSFRCSNCRAYLCKTTTESFNLLLRCARCLKPTNMLQSLKLLQKSEGKFNQAIELMNSRRFDTAVGILLENITLFDSILLPPFQDYHWCQEGLRKCYLPLGNKTNSLKFNSSDNEQGAIVKNFKK